MMLKEVFGFRDMLTMWINKEMGETFLEDSDWDIATIMLEFLNVFFLI